MSIRIIIDGYNLIKQSSSLRSHDLQDPARERVKLIEKLACYRTIKGNSIVVVFDGWREGNPVEQHTKERGIDIIYSRRGEKADEVIKRLVTHSREPLLVVTSDHEITHFCQSRRCEVITAHLFEEKIELCWLNRMKGSGENDDDHDLPLLRSTKKRGPSKKLPKSKRRLLRQLKKL
jgi:predicted RNA-binding protein with PIN domain